MFDFEKLDVYKVIRGVVLKALQEITSNQNIDPYMKDQWRRANLSALLNLAEGTGRVSTADKKHFYMVARSSVFECVAILDLLLELKIISQENFKSLYENYEQVSKMLLGMYRSHQNQ